MLKVDLTDPSFVPPASVARIWAAQKLHVDSRSPLPFDRKRASLMLRLLDGGAHSQAYLTRVLADYGPSGTVIPGLVWFPILRPQEPPWISARRGVNLSPQTRADLDDQSAAVLEHLLVRAEALGLRTQAEGVLVKLIRELRRGRGLVAATACAGVYSLLDVMTDGRMDHIVRWCRMLLPRHFPL